MTMTKETCFNCIWVHNDDCDTYCNKTLYLDGGMNAFDLCDDESDKDIFKYCPYCGNKIMVQKFGKE
jgi:DNA-directed RNA polymerase subunit RPC12/RpoP